MQLCFSLALLLNFVMIVMEGDCGFLDVDCQEEIVKDHAKKRSGNSKIFKCIIACLNENRHPHMLKYNNEEKTQFQLTLCDKKSSKWDEKYISLFKDFDATSPKKRKVENYAEECKSRAKANILKLVNSNCLESLGNEKDTPYTYLTYQILKFPEENQPRQLATKVKRKRKLVKPAEGVKKQKHTSPEINTADNTGSLILCDSEYAVNQTQGKVNYTNVSTVDTTSINISSQFGPLYYVLLSPGNLDTIYQTPRDENSANTITEIDTSSIKNLGGDDTVVDLQGSQISQNNFLPENGNTFNQTPRDENSANTITEIDTSFKNLSGDDTVVYLQGNRVSQNSFLLPENANAFDEMNFLDDNLMLSNNYMNDKLLSFNNPILPPWDTTGQRKENFPGNELLQNHWMDDYKSMDEIASQFCD